MSLIPLSFWKNNFSFEYPPIADHGWSLIKRNPNYNGFCIRIRRSSDSTEQDFGFVNGILDYLSINTFISGSSALVAKWYDQFGSYDMVPFYYVNGNQYFPIIGSAGSVFLLNNLPYITFSGTLGYTAMIAGVGNNLTSYKDSTVFYTYLNYSNSLTGLCGNSNGNSLTTLSSLRGTGSSTSFWDWSNVQNYFVNENIAAQGNRITTETFVTTGDLFSATEYLRSRDIPKLMAERGVGWNALGTGHSIGGRGNGSFNNAFNGYLNEYLIYKSTKTDEEVRDTMKILNKVHSLYDKDSLNTDLILHYDAGNSLSYSGSGTTLNDISGNAPSGGGGGAVLNNCTFSLNDGGKFILTSSNNSFIDTTTYANEYPWNVSGADFTMEAWVKFTNATQQSLILVKRNTSTGGALMMVAGTIGFNTIIASKKISVFLMNQNGDRWLLMETTNDIIDGNWKHIIVTRSNNALNIYVNGINQSLTQLSSQAGTSFKYVEANSSWKVGDWGSNTGGQFNGEVSILRLYKSELTQLQVTRNFNLEKSRYGL